ncbi:hypothetical protein HPP92_001234 [Vanilla planifolia]|uniref:RIN4 pathogenic type III effector avirulence factor Avr cleavage site domain-containing protein n=1 Tax=Vanilla planifolia TaxID=51239 RepID=A0A835SBK6_VANPL|nr:hypothetical protein HPP92_001234 [Vanilla planifolia]
MAEEASHFGKEEGDGDIPNQIADQHKTPGMTIKPSDTDGSTSAVIDGESSANSLSAPTVTESENPKTRENNPQGHTASPQRRTTIVSSGVSSPSWEKKGPSDGLHGTAPTTPGRSRLWVGSRSDESPEESWAVPKFGEWDESNPASADGFTGIFEKVREEKHTSATKVPMLNDDSVYLSSFQRDKGSKKSAKRRCFCFIWGKK